METKVANMEGKNGNRIPNQFCIHANGCKFFQSYESIIIKIDENNNVFLDETYYNYSKTASKYRNMFLRETTKEIEQKIKNGTYKLTNLNK